MSSLPNTFHLTPILSSFFFGYTCSLSTVPHLLTRNLHQPLFSRLVWAFKMFPWPTDCEIFSGQEVKLWSFCIYEVAHSCGILQWYNSDTMTLCSSNRTPRLYSFKWLIFGHMFKQNSERIFSVSQNLFLVSYYCHQWWRSTETYGYVLVNGKTHAR